MNTKTVKEKVEEIIKENVWGCVCKECKGGGGSPDKCPKCDGLGITDWEYEIAVKLIDKLYRNEMIKLIESKTHACSIDAYDLGNICNSDELIKLI